MFCVNEMTKAKGVYIGSLWSSKREREQQSDSECKQSRGKAMKLSV